ncbi:hypothetical protein ABT294_27520 [Nonomuraea sp. NPDC000554]|uniref:hypothetical protein n=1 Tax=Nonomuraea sp. NPDC000554 TaxID=3154259 RepID=UPI003331360A
MNRPAPRKRRRTPRSDWQFPILTHLGIQPQRQKLLVIIASVAGVLAMAAGLVTVVASLGEYAPERQASAAVLALDSDLPVEFHAWSSPKLFAPVGTRAKDAKPLTKEEVFGQRTLTGEKKLTLKLAGSRVDNDCAAAMWGEELLDQLGDAGCSQAARGLYVSSDGRYLGQYTLLNLRDGEAATELVDSLKTLYRGGWAKLLDGAKVSFPQGGHTEAGGYALGHYVGLVWIGRADGREPNPKDDFVSLTLALRGAEKAVYRRVVAITGPAS